MTWEQITALLVALGASGVIQWLIGGPARRRASVTAEHDTAMTGWIELHKALRSDYEALRSEAAVERIACAEKIAGLQKDIIGMQQKVASMEAMLYKYETVNTPIALREAARAGAEAFLAAAQSQWDGNERRTNE